MTSGETKLIQRAQKGDALALARLHDLYYKDVYRFFYYRVDDDRLVEQLTAGLFIRMVEEVGLFKLESEPFQIWLCRLAHGLMLEELLKRDIQYQDNSLEDDCRDDWGQPATWFKHALAQLTANERDVITGKLIEKRPAKAIARETGHTVHSVLSLQASALGKLAQMDSNSALAFPSEKDFAHQLEKAILLQQTRQPIESVLAKYPENVESLTPLLQEAHKILKIPNPALPAGALAGSKSQMMESLSRKKTLSAKCKEDVMGHLGTGLRRKHDKRLVLVLLSLALFFILLSTLCVSAVYSLPGSCLYPVKLRLEEIHILLTADPAAKTKLAAHYQRLRIEDLQKAVDLGRLTAADAQATLTAMPTATPFAP